MQVYVYKVFHAQYGETIMRYGLNIFRALDISNTKSKGVKRLRSLQQIILMVGI